LLICCVIASFFDNTRCESESFTFTFSELRFIDCDSTQWERIPWASWSFFCSIKNAMRNFKKRETKTLFIVTIFSIDFLFMISFLTRIKVSFLFFYAFAKRIVFSFSWEFSRCFYSWNERLCCIIWLSKKRIFFVKLILVETKKLHTNNDNIACRVLFVW
jgi:hypothetical protein